MAELAIALTATDGGDQDQPGKLLTWDLQAVYSALSQNPAYRSLFPAAFPLQPDRLTSETGTFAFDVQASATRYFSVTAGPGVPTMALSISTPTGARLSETSEPQITIVRIR